MLKQVLTDAQEQQIRLIANSMHSEIYLNNRRYLQKRSKQQNQLILKEVNQNDIRVFTQIPKTHRAFNSNSSLLYAKFFK